MGSNGTSLGSTTHYNLGLSSVPTPSSSQIRDEISFLEEKLAVLEVTVGALNGRFETVLSQHPPVPSTVDKVNAQPAFSVLARLHDLNSHVTGVTIAIQDIIQRAEV